MSAFAEYVDEVRMRRAHAFLIFTYLAACVCVMLEKEAWRYARKRKRNGLRRM